MCTRLILFAPLLLAAACNGDDMSDPDTDTDTDAETVSLSADVMPLVQLHCGGCHQREGGQAEAVVNDVYFEEKGDLLGLVGTFIIAGDSSSSGFMGVLSGDTAVGSGPTTMPPAGNTITDDELAMVAAWIDAGAEDN